MEKPEQIDLLIVDDDTEFRRTLVQILSKRGYQPQAAADATEALGFVERRQFDVAVIDIGAPGQSDLELLETLKATQPECEVIILTVDTTTEPAIQAMRQGIFNCLTKPYAFADLERAIERAAERRQLLKENRQLKAALDQRHGEFANIGESPAIRSIKALIEQIGPTEKIVLIQGECGTGKELVARALHHHSLRAARPLVVIRCAGTSDDLLESELFGYEKGEFTGQPGLFEIADLGTLFIDEIGEFPAGLQAKLLRILEDGSVCRIGSLKARRLSVRILAATQYDLATQVMAGRFSAELYRRINGITIDVPPLRERSADIPLLIHRFLGDSWHIAPEAIAALEKYHWPGNIRQLFDVIHQAESIAEGHRICSADLPREIFGNRPVDAHSLPVRSDSLSSIKRSHIAEVLDRERGNKSRTARALGLNRRSLYRLLDRFQLRTS